MESGVASLSEAPLDLSPFLVFFLSRCFLDFLFLDFSVEEDLTVTGCLGPCIYVGVAWKLQLMRTHRGVCIHMYMCAYAHTC